MAYNLGKAFGVVPIFDPQSGMLVRAPLNEGAGWWAGAPTATFDAISNTFFLVYRHRQPRELGRGIECRIAASDNGVTFKDIWALPKTSLAALSIERCSLVRGVDGLWRLYISYVNAADARWRISMLEANEPDQFQLKQIRSVLTPEELGVEGVKDPNVFLMGRMTYMLVSYATTESNLSPEALAARHATGDIYNTGLTLSRTGAAISGNGRDFQWIGDISPVGGTQSGVATEGERAPVPWDHYCRRIGTLLPLDAGGYLAFYDGSGSVGENYEEKTGLAHSFDLRTFYSLTPDAPALTSPQGSGSLRYVDVVPVGHELFYYYEIANADGSHELRVNVVERD